MIAQRIIDWEPLRKAFLEGTPRPTYAELSEQFGVSVAAIGKCSLEEGWPALREAAMERKLLACDAQQVILEAVQVDRTFIRKFVTMGIVALDKLTQTLESVDEKRAAQTKASAINTCMFAAANLAKALHEVGIVGVTKTLNDAGKEDNGRWDPKLLNQINVTVQNLTGKAEPQAATVDAKTDPVPEPSPTT